MYNLVVEALAGHQPRAYVKAKAADRDKPGFPNVNFHDGQVAVASAAAVTGAAPVAGTTADFDSDGIADLVTADSAGSLTFFKGNPDTRYPYSPSAKQRYSETGAEPTAFSEARSVASLPFSADFLATGDFNVDGKNDVLAAVKNSETLALLAGNGQAGFAAPQTIELGGRLVAIEASEIGREDDQQDIAVAVMSKTGPQLLIFEWLHGAFAQKPEVHKLSFVPDSLAIGDLDGDFYHDVAISGGSRLMIVHGRGQAYPYDRMDDYNIKRPDAVIENRTMPFEIAAISIGLFTEKRGRSIAILTKNGSVEILETVKSPPTKAELARAEAVRKISKPSPFVPAGVHPTEKAALTAKMPTTAEEADSMGMLMADSSLSRKEIEEKIKEASMQRDKEFLKLPSEAQAAKKVAAEQRRVAKRERASRKFESSISAKLELPLARWSLKTIIADSRLVNAAAMRSKMTRVRVSDSGRDDLILQNRSTGRIEIVTQTRTEVDSIRNTEVVSLESPSGINAVISMRLNGDALDDLVELRADSPSPSVRLTGPASVFVVTTDDDVAQAGQCDGSVPCNLRRAILLSNGNPGADQINFNIPGAGVHTIHPATPLPTITNSVNIFGESQPGADFGNLLIEIKGDLLTGAVEGLRVNTSNAVVGGLVINEMPSILHDGNSQEGGSGIVILSTSSFPNASNNEVRDCFLGVDPTGSIPKGNHGNGISIFDSDNNFVGTGSGLDDNFLAGNGKDDEGKRGVGLAITGSDNNFIRGNVIGQAVSGATWLGNSYGVFLGGRNNEFGGDFVGFGNTVSGNGVVFPPPPVFCGGVGIDEGIIIDPATGELLTLANRYKGNDIGAIGNVPLGNCSRGIQVSNIAQPVIGSLIQDGRNVISNNGYDGIWTFGDFSDEYDPGFVRIIGNNIGANRAGNVAMPNDQRNGCVGFCVASGDVNLLVGEGSFVSVGEPAFTTPGGSCTGGCNLVSGSGNSLSIGAIHRSGFGQVFIHNNYIGTDITGTSALGGSAFASGNGVLAFFSDTNIGVAFDDGLGGFTSTRNVISGNGANGIILSTGGIFQNEGLEGKFRVEGNYIGVSANGLSAIPNSTQPDNDIFGQAVASFTNSTGYTLIGNTGDTGRNIISGNQASGIALHGVGTQIVGNNWIGLNAAGAPLGNRLHGIRIEGSFAKIGGAQVERRNVIWNNGRSGIIVFSPISATTLGNSFGNNSFHDNVGLGIDLTNTYNVFTGATDGVTANDCYDFDGGANELQNYPELQEPIVNPDNTTKLNGTLRSYPSRTYTINFYANSAFGTAYGQGEFSAGTRTVTTDGNGFVSFSFDTPEVWPVGYLFIATATDGAGSTSEFSCPAGLCTPTADPCEAPIVVNVNTDEPDANTADLACDIDVSNTGLQCTLRAAIQEANVRPGRNIINFDIPGAGLIHTISPLTQLPALTERVFINGRSQPGNYGPPLIEVRGDAGSATNGLVVNAHSEIYALTINRFPGAGILIDRTLGPVDTGSEIVGNFIGLNTNGQSAADGPQMQYGISITGSSPNNKIGVTGLGNGNVIANCSLAAIHISGSGATGNKVIGNRIGFQSTGLNTIVNGTHGILLNSSTRNNTIGDTVENGNRISGTSEFGIALEGSANNNTIIGNLIGTDPDGNASPTLGDIGLVIRGGAFQNKIGTGPEHRNVISGHTRTFGSAGIRIEPGAGFGNTFAANYIGLNMAGNVRVPNYRGVLIQKDGFSFGGGVHNVISGNTTYGVQIETAGNTIMSGTLSKNYIGTDGTGQADLALGNSVGVVVAGQVTGITVSDSVISGNGVGVSISQGADATVQKNIIGLNATGTGVVPNFYGVVVNTTVQSTIKENAIAGNIYGILLGDTTGGFIAEALPNVPKPVLKPVKAREGVTVLTENIQVQNNYIGINKTGTLVFRNRFASIAIGENARNNLIGGKRSGEGNTISGGEFVTGFGTGIFLGTFDDKVDPNRIPQFNVIQGNKIGIRRTQYIAMPNNLGIFVQNATNNLIGAVDCEYGNGSTGSTARRLGDDPPECNVNDHSNIIGGNIREGILMRGSGANNNLIISNYIGVAPDGTKIGNGEVGIRLEDVNNTTIDKNTISGNNEGILLNGVSTFQNRIRANYIGTNAATSQTIGNTLSGIHINQGAHDNIVGGPEPNSGNTIAYNGGAGVWIDNSAGIGNMVDPNTIHHNGGVGIDLGDLGRTSNDPGDGDEGPNRGQNSPEISEYLIDGNGDLIVRYRVDSTPGNSNYGILGIYVEFFRSDGSGEGELFLDSDLYSIADWSTGSPGDKTVNLGNAASIGFLPGYRLTASATDASNNTSEFTPVFFPTAAMVTVGGRVVDANGRGIQKAVIKISDMSGRSRQVLSNTFGYYKFFDVEAGQSYVISAAYKRYQFKPDSVVVSVTDNLSNVDFVALSSR